jgi:Zn-dependent protease with chaperone function
MNFFERQRQVRRLSVRLVVLFAVAVIGIVMVVDLVALLAFNRQDMTPASVVGTLIVATALTTLVILGASVFRTLSLRGGGAKVARDVGGVLVPENTQDPQLRRLRNVVEEIAIASGTPVPQIYVLEHEQSINAFAAGWSPADAAIAVTRGSLEQLNRDELQGVIAHEFSHVVNGDMRLNIRLVGLLFGIMFLAIIGRTLIYFGGGRGRDRSNNPLPLIGIALLVGGYLGVLIGRVIQASVSRQREYLADASAVQFTRQTTGIAGALKKIAGVPTGSTLRSRRKDEVEHMLFGSAFGRSADFSSLFATHPPLERRIKALEPDWDPRELTQLSRAWAVAAPSGLAEDAALGLAPAANAVPASSATVHVSPDSVVNSVAAPTDESYRQAEAILNEVPKPLLDRARNPQTVTALVLGLLIAADGRTRDAQLATVAQFEGPALASEAAAVADDARALNPLLRLPLAQIAFPVLVRAGDPNRLLRTTYALIQADRVIDPFEYCLSRLMHRELYEAVNRRPPWPMQRRSMAEAMPAVTELLTILGQSGTDDPNEAAAAVALGLESLGVTAAYRPPAQGIFALENLWALLDGLAPMDKQRLVTAMVMVIGSDGTMTTTEAELLRTICAMLHCPLPPLTPQIPV